MLNLNEKGIEALHPNVFDGMGAIEYVCTYFVSSRAVPHLQKWLDWCKTVCCVGMITAH